MRQLKKALQRHLFPAPGQLTPGFRFANFADNWQQQDIANLIIRNTTKNKQSTLNNVESISNQSGFVKQTSQFPNASLSPTNLSNYYIVNPGYFAYNPSRINVGSIAYKTGSHACLVSPLYVSFYTIPGINDQYFWEWLQTDAFINQRRRLSNRGIRDTLSFEQLAEMKLKFGSYQEQKMIADLLTIVDQQITITNQKIAKLEGLKKALLQKMIL
ncbi:restriction endonuclease subunit S [Fructilactobacillus ixorae]|uniref:Restriction endonuclease subunit S n=1 Tax=Fructilactobacillus ixorae TaxID=1750535 RepID=A0ABY5C720_9LACO|nr:restriction endonuclease subunit S [Fructilactobacillus ixorae]USS93106.1 restriction endonuclease subunit S [Fructilactobacillus ixorae]